ncbi:YncE family protein [Pigmentiphaga humi]|uniref:YVTN family beta-propeller repeat protein n=1 Tax=Pigmentiphaga humi TaxID=2478468 RepID=UPI003CCC625A
MLVARLAAVLGLCAAFAVSAALPAPPIIVLNSLDASVSVLDPVTYAETRRIPTGKEPHHIYLTPDDKSLLVANAASDSLTFIDPLTGDVQRTMTGIVDPYQLRFSPDMKWFVTAANRLDHIDIYQWNGLAGSAEPKLARRIPASRTPSHLTIDSKSRNLYVSLQDSDQLTAIDLATQTPLWTIGVGKTPADVYITADDRYLLVALTGDKYVEVYDLSVAPARLAKRIETGAGAHAFRAQGDGRHLFVSNRAANTISRIDLQSMGVVDSYPAPGGPDCMEVLADGKTLLVTSRWAKKLTVIDTVKKAVVHQTKVGRSPHGVWTLSHAPR